MTLALILRKEGHARVTVEIENGSSAYWMDANRDRAYRAEPFGLSLGDQFCLALAARQDLPAATADMAWFRLAEPPGVQIKTIRSPHA